MIKYSKPVLFLLFASSIFLLGLNISEISIDGLGNKRETFVHIANLFVFSSSTYVFYNLLYKSKKDN